MSAIGTIFNIQRFTIHDGPGIRTELFLKGCPLHCSWCGNPESHNAAVEPGVYPAKCIGEDVCGRCRDACPHGAIRFRDGVITAIDREKCVGCMACADACPSDAIKSWGRQMTVEETMDLILRDRSYYERSGGGITVSGGEPLLQKEFVRELFEACRKEKIHTCLESTLGMDRETVLAVLPAADLVITDIKMMDSAAHAKYVGMENGQILENIRFIAEQNVPLIIRIPVIPGINDSMQNMEESARFIKEDLKGRIIVLQLLEYMRLGEEKYRSLDRVYPMAGLKLDRESFHSRVEQFAEYMNGQGIPCVVGTSEKEPRL